MAKLLYQLGDVLGNRTQQRAQPGGAPDNIKPFRRDFLYRDTGQRLVQHIAEQLRFVFGNRRGGAGQLVFNLAGRRNSHNHEVQLINRNQLKTPDDRAAPRRGDRNRSIIGQRGNQAARLLDQPVKLLDLHPCHTGQRVVVTGGRNLNIPHQFIDIQPVAERGRNPTRRGMRLFQVAHFLKLAHLVADSGGGIINTGHGCESLGSNRFCGQHIFADDCFQDLFFALGKLHRLPPPSGVSTLSPRVLTLIYHRCRKKSRRNT